MSDLNNKIENYLPLIQGWCSADKAKKFAEIIVATKPDLCVEIGVFGGSSLIPQALALKQNNKGIIIGIDPWKTEDALEEMIHEDHREWWAKLNIEDVFKHATENLTKFKVANFCKLIRDKAENVVNQFADESIDVLHIDGNHSEVLSYKDATLYLPKVKIGGYIFFDDIWWTEVGNHVTTRKAIGHLLNYCERIDLVNNDCMIMRKTSS